VIKPVADNSLRKTGIFAERAGDFRRFPPQDRRTGSPETNRMREKPVFAASHVSRAARPNAGMAGWRRSADRTCLYENSLVSGNFTGNFAISGLLQPIPEQETAALQHFPEQFPKSRTEKEAE
jgi:hypothetical protein